MLDTFMNRWTQALEKIEALRLDELSQAELLQAVQSIRELRAELDAFEAKVRAELHRRAVASRFN
jgi:hypothetical protein